MGLNEAEYSEYDGAGVMPSTLHPKGASALTPDEKLRLQSLTGQEVDTNAPLDPGFWQGNSYFDPNAAPPVDRARVQRERQIEREQRNRYKPTRRR